MTSVIVASSLLMLGSALLDLGTTSGHEAVRRTCSTQALELASSAVNYSLAELRKNAGYTGFERTAFAQGSFSATVSTPAGQPTYRVITGQAIVNHGDLAVTRTVRQTVQLSTIASLFKATIASRKSVSISGNVHVNSTPTLHEGWVHSNTNLTLGGSMGVDGKATATGALGPGTASHAVSSAGGQPPINFPPVTQEFKELGLPNGRWIGNLTVSDGRTLPGKVEGDLSIGLPSGGILSGVVWVTGSLTINGPLLGTGTIVCDGKIYTMAQASLGTLNSLAFISTSSAPDALNLSGNGAFVGMLYAPNGGVQLQGNATYYGSILADSINFGGTPTITRWTGFDANPPPLPGEVKPLGWEQP